MSATLLIRLLAAGCAALAATLLPDATRAAAASFRDCDSCPQMMPVPAGQFMMGAAPGEEERENLSEPFRHRSQPQRLVKVQPFTAGKFEVTRGEYRAFADATGHRSEGCFAWTGAAFELDARRNWRNTGYGQDDTHPVVCVSWDDANTYTRWLSQKTGKPYRLLTEAEWEYAARAGARTARFWGDDASQICDYANGADQAAVAQLPAARLWDSAACHDRYAYTAPAGSYRANAFGLHDMLGNVGEWTQDCWNANYNDAPADQQAWTAGDCTLRAVRGGAWDDAPVGLRTAYRVGSPTTIRLYSRGFRVAREN